MQLRSPVFEHLSPIPYQYSGEGQNLSPALEWSGLPNTCKELALLCEDPDAPLRPGTDHPFVHWLIYNIPADEKGLHKGIANERALTNPFRVYQGLNSFKKIGYGGPMPPEGHGVHRYIFTLYALDQELNLEPGLEKKDVLPLFEMHTIQSTKLIGTYERPQISPSYSYQTSADSYRGLRP